MEYRVKSPNFYITYVFQYYYLNIKILKFYERWNFRNFWKFWNLNFFEIFEVLTFFENFEILNLNLKKNYFRILNFFENFRNFEIFWNFWNFEIFEVLKFFVQLRKGSKVSSIVCRAIVSWRLLTRQSITGEQKTQKYLKICSYLINKKKFTIR